MHLKLTIMVEFLWNKIFYVAILVYSLDHGRAEDIPGCPTRLPNSDGLAVYGDKCYHFVHTEKYWTRAREYCHDLSGDIVKLDSRDKHDFIEKQMYEMNWRNSGVWIGLNDRQDEGSWQWESRTGHDERAHWTNWQSGHPTRNWFLQGRDCVRMVRDDGWRWHEVFCSSFDWRYRFICEYDYTPPPTSQDSLSDENPEARGLVDDKSNDHTAIFVGLGIGIGLLLLLVIILVLVLLHRRNRRKLNAANQGSQTQTNSHAFHNQAYTSDVVENEYTREAATGNGHTGQTDRRPSPPPSYVTYDNPVHDNRQNAYAEALPTKENLYM